MLPAGRGGPAWALIAPAEAELEQTRGSGPDPRPHRGPAPSRTPLLPRGRARDQRRRVRPTLRGAEEARGGAPRPRAPGLADPPGRGGARVGLRPGAPPRADALARQRDGRG